MPEVSFKDWRHLEFVAPIVEVTQANTSDEPLTIKGVAITETTTRNGITYVAEELSLAAPTFRNKPILKDHNNSVDSIVGKTTENVNFIEADKHIGFEAVIFDPKMKQMISQGLVSNVSIGAMVHNIEEIETESEDGEVTKQLIARGMEGVEISLVAVPGDKNATLAQAMYESFELKNKTHIVKETSKEESLMAEEQSKIDTLREERVKLEEELMVLQVEKLRVEKAALQKQIKIAEEAEAPAAEEPVAEEEAPAAEEKPAAEPAAEEMVKQPIENKTRGMIKNSEEVAETFASKGYVIERTESGDNAFGLASYDALKYKRLGR